MQFSERLRRLDDGSAAEAVYRGPRTVIDLTMANPTQANLPYAWDAIATAYAKAAQAPYVPEPLGMLSARKFFAKDGALPFLTASTSEAYSYVLKLLCDPGDHVLVQAPSYPLLDVLCALEGIERAAVPLHYDGMWHIDVGYMRSVCTPRTKAIFLVNPNNPTGSYVRQSEFDAIAALGLPIVLDEVFHPFAYAQEPPPLHCERGLLFRMSGLSKMCGLPQAKLAWTTVHGSPDLVRTALQKLELIGDAFLSASGPTMHAAADLFTATHAMRTALRARLLHNRAFLGEALLGTSLSLLHAEGGWYASIRLPKTCSDEVAARDLYLATGVRTHSGTLFGFGSMSVLVLSLLPPKEDFEAAIVRIVEHFA